MLSRLWCRLLSKIEERRLDVERSHRASLEAYYKKHPESRR